MTIIIHFHQSSYRNFKAYYTKHVMLHLQSEFPNLVSYNRFVELMPRTIGFLLVYLYSLRGSCTGISFVDSTLLKVCHNRRIDHAWLRYAAWPFQQARHTDTALVQLALAPAIRPL